MQYDSNIFITITSRIKAVFWQGPGPGLSWSLARRAGQERFLIGTWDVTSDVGLLLLVSSFQCLSIAKDRNTSCFSSHLFNVSPAVLLQFLSLRYLALYIFFLKYIGKRKAGKDRVGMAASERDKEKRGENRKRRQGSQNAGNSAFENQDSTVRQSLCSFPLLHLILCTLAVKSLILFARFLVFLQLLLFSVSSLNPTTSARNRASACNF